MLQGEAGVVNGKVRKGEELQRGEPEDPSGRPSAVAVCEKPCMEEGCRSGTGPVLGLTSLPCSKRRSKG